MRLPIIILVSLMLWNGSGCTTVDAQTGEPLPPEDQRYVLEDVEARLPNLRVGMSMTEVLLTLGSPAEQKGDSWIYKPSRSGVFLPAKALVVKFRDRRYVEYEYQPIVLGGRMHLD